MSMHAAVSGRLHPDHVPRTRKELVWYLWNKGRTDCNLIKEGPFYAAWVGNEIRATHERTIDRLTCAGWEATHFYERKETRI